MTGIDKAIVFVMDDVRYDQFKGLLEDNYLPNINKYVYDNSIHSKCISVFPGITVPAQLAVQTGTYTDEFSVPGMHWWLRHYRCHARAGQFPSVHGPAIPRQEWIPVGRQAV